MPNNQFESHTVIPVKGIGLVAVPRGTPLADLHFSIVNHSVYQSATPPDLSYPEKGDPSLPAELEPIPSITERGAIENSPQFKKAASEAWNRAQDRPVPAEASFLIRRGVNGVGISPISVADTVPNQNAETEQRIYPSTIDAFHTHPPTDEYGQHPSPADVAAAEQAKRPIMVASKDGLFEIDALGNVRQIFSNTSWMKLRTERKR